MKKTNAANILDAKSISYELIEYEVDETDLSATALVKKIGEDIEQIFKTLVIRGDKTGVFVCVIPGNTEVNLKKAAKISGNKILITEFHTKEYLSSNLLFYREVKLRVLRSTAGICHRIV